MKRARLLALALALVMVFSLLPVTALAAGTKTEGKILGKGTVDLNFDAEKAYVGDYTIVSASGAAVDFSCYRATYCANPITGLEWAGRPSEDFFKLNVYVPKGYTDEQLKNAPILMINPWGGDNGSPVSLDPTTHKRKMPAMALERGWVVVEPGMRGNNCYTGELGGEDYCDYGKLPYPIADLKAAVRYLRYGDNAETIPGNKERIFFTGTSSGGDATVMIGSSGNSDFFTPYLEELGAADARDDVFCAAPSCPVMNREWGDPAIAWERWGDLSDNADALKLNAELCSAYIEYFNALGLKAEFDVPAAGIKKGDKLTDKNYADYLLVYEKQAAVKFLNSLGGKDAVDEYLASEKGKDMYGHPAISRSMLRPVWSEDGKTVTDLDNTWEEIWYYNVGGEEHMNVKNVLNMQYDTPIDDEDLTAFEENGVLNTKIGARADGRANASNYTFGKSGDYACVLSSFGQDWLEKERGMTVSKEYRELIALQNHATDPMYFIVGEGATDEVTTAPNWYMRTGSVDLVVPTPNFFALAIALQNRGYTVDEALVWDQSHGETTDLDGFFRFASELLAKDKDDSLNFDANAAYKGTYTVDGTAFKVYQATYCAKPVTGLTWGGAASEDYFKLNISVPDGMTREELAKAPILVYNPWGGDNGKPVYTPGEFGTDMQKEAIKRGWVVVEPGMRGNNCYTGTIGEDDYYDYGKLPYPLADLKAAIRYLRYGDNAASIPGDKDRIWIAGTSSGGCATVMIGSSGDSEFFKPYLDEIGAADTSDAVYGAAPSCPVMNRSWGDPALAWERWGDLTGVEGANEVNVMLSQMFVEYFNTLGLKAEFSTGSVKKGDALTTDNLAEYLYAYVKQAGIKFLNELGSREAIEKYLAEEKSGDMMYGTSATKRDWIKPVFDANGTVTDIEGTYAEFWHYCVGDDYYDYTKEINWQYDKPSVAPEDCFKSTGSGAMNGNVGQGLFAPWANASSFSFGVPNDVAAVFTEFGQRWITEKRGMSISDDYAALISMQRNSVNPMYFVTGEGAKGATGAQHWFMRTGTVDLVTPHPIFISLATALKNRGTDVDVAFVWDQRHGLTSELEEFFEYADKTMGRAAAFSDVRDGDWYAEYVSYVAANGLMNGVSDDRFDPNGSVSRAMVVTVLYRMAGSPAVTGETKFTDLTADWYRAAVKWAVDSGVTTGTSETTFAPNAAITREQLAVMLLRYAQFMKYDTAKRAELGSFTDAGSVSAYARDAMAWANGTGLITGESASTLNPAGGSSRAVLATVLTRFAKTIG